MQFLKTLACALALFTSASLAVPNHIVTERSVNLIKHVSPGNGPNIPCAGRALNGLPFQELSYIDPWGLVCIYGIGLGPLPPFVCLYEREQGYLMNRGQAAGVCPDSTTNGLLGGYEKEKSVPTDVDTNTPELPIEVKQDIETYEHTLLGPDAYKCPKTNIPGWKLHIQRDAGGDFQCFYAIEDVDVGTCVYNPDSGFLVGEYPDRSCFPIASKIDGDDEESKSATFFLHSVLKTIVNLFESTFDAEKK